MGLLFLLYVGDVVWQIEHLGLVQNLIYDARSSYKNLAYALGLDPALVTGIEQSKHWVTDECFSEILREVLQSGLSRKKLADVLESKTLRFGQLAKRVREANFCKLFNIHRVSLLL